jgi:hypothetical protein
MFPRLSIASAPRTISDSCRACTVLTTCIDCAHSPPFVSAEHHFFQIYRLYRTTDGFILISIYIVASTHPTHSILPSSLSLLCRFFSLPSVSILTSTFPLLNSGELYSYQPIVPYLRYLSTPFSRSSARALLLFFSLIYFPSVYIFLPSMIQSSNYFHRRVQCIHIQVLIHWL